MKRVFFILAFFLLLTVPVLAVDAEPAPESEALPQAFEAEFDELQEPVEIGEGQYDELYAELAQLRANTDYIFLGVIAMSGVILGCSVGITLIRLWGA